MDLIKLKIKLRMFDPFLGSIAYMVKMEEFTEGLMATDGVTIFYNPEKMDTLPLDQQIAVLAHECCHIALNHPGRLKDHGYIPQLWNIATDMVINYYLRRVNKMELPPGVLYPPPEFKDASSEELYQYLLNKNKKHTKSFSNSSYRFDPIGQDIQMPKSEKAIQEAKTLIYQSKGLPGAKNFSVGHDEFARVHNELFAPPKLPWEYLLKKFVDEKFPEDYSWARPNRRYLDYMYLPSICDGQTVKRVKVYLDVSGSIDQKTLDMFLSEVRGILRNLKIEQFKLVFWSVGIDKEIDYSENILLEDIPSKGGTNISEVISDINTSKNTVSIIFTDGFFNPDPIASCLFPIIWVIYDQNKFKPVKGQVVELPM